MLSAPVHIRKPSYRRLISVVTPERTHCGHRVAQNMLLTSRNQLRNKLDFPEQTETVFWSPL